MTPEKLKSIIESILFISSGSVTSAKIGKLLPEVSPSDIREAVAGLVEEYRQKNGGIFIAEVSGGYQFRTNPENKEWLNSLTSQNRRLSQAAVETLAVIAYSQPLIRSDIEHIRGVDSGGPIRKLLDLNLIRITGKKDIPGRPLIYGTTAHFLEFFNLRSLEDLPDLKEFSALQKKPGDPVSKA